jgi:LPXTG-motif cell wall-anchored protein
MRSNTSRRRLAVAAVGIAVVTPLALTGAASARPSAHSDAVHGTIKGFATGDFAFVDAISVPHLNVAQGSIAQSAAGVSNRSMQTSDTLGQSVLNSKSVKGNNAYAHASGVSVNLGQGDKTNPQVQLTRAEATSPKPSSDRTDLIKVPLAPVATADVQPDVAVANTTSSDDFCVLGAPLSEGTATVADAEVLPVQPGLAVATADGTVRQDSTEELDPNGAGALGLNSVETLNTAGVTLFEGVPGAAIKIKIVNPLILQAFAGGVKGSAKVSFGSNDGKKDLLSISAGGNKAVLTVEQVLGGKGATIPIVGKVGNKTLHLLDIEIGGEPNIKLAANGTMASAVADLVKVQVINKFGKTKVKIDGPLGPILQPILDPVVGVLDQIVGTLQSAVESLGLTKGVDLRIGHFEANAEVPVGGIHCGLPVTKSTNKDPVQPGDQFTVTIAASNPYDCVIKNVSVDDHITATDGVKWTVGDTRPKADQVSNHRVVWNNIGDIKPGQHKFVQVDISIDADSAPGKMSDTADVTGSCATGNADGTSNVNLKGTFTLHAPTIKAGSSPILPDTGMTPALPIGAGLLLAAGFGVALVRRRVTD